ncbi:hypothetical protein KL949_002702 [Ogataea haglerorum]|nr:hypothetical protein KL913_002440 [Ogataea haglerorum]KAG7718706.1 hypothetical protein KL949_002702 [Ogataea haglerorum]KAG7766985.1 hypothetical protein KL931_003869 [Ogataea haglerorum]
MKKQRMTASGPTVVRALRHNSCIRPPDTMELLNKALLIKNVSNGAMIINAVQIMSFLITRLEISAITFRTYGGISAMLN